MRDHLRRGALATITCFCLLAPAAHAGLSNWTSLVGLTSSQSADWVRVYATGTPPTTIYAGTEGDGVYKSINDGLTWSPYSSGLPSDGAGVNVYTIYTSGGDVYIGTDSGLWSTNDSISTSDAAWMPVAQGAETDPQHPTKLNASVQTVLSLGSDSLLAGTASFGVYRSGDGGKTWTPPADDNGMPAATTVWGLTSFATFVWAATSDGIYRSTDGGATWSYSGDGIPDGAITLGIFQDSGNPLIYYAETGSDGIYRSIDGGTSWQSINGDPNGEPFGGSSTPIVRNMVEFSGTTQTRLYVATSDGLWAGTLPNVAIPGPVPKSIEVPGTPVWRQVTQQGLGDNLIFWGLSSFTTVPGTLLAGTQSNGGYSLTFQPPANDHAAQNLPSWLVANVLALKVGTALVGTSGNWTGTETIDYSYQWQRCTSSSGGCSDIGGATDHDYSLAPADQGKYIRLVVTASNDFPSFSPINTADSVIRGPVGAAPGPLPGANQESAPEIYDETPGADPALPTEGDTLGAPAQSPDYPGGWLLNPGPSGNAIGYEWLRCDANAANCAPIPGASNATYALTAADDGNTIEVIVKGNNNNGTTTLPTSGPTNTITPLAARDLAAPALLGKAYVGYTLVGTVGTWASPNTWWSRQWLQCQPDGTGCSTIQGATGPSYTIGPGDLGMTIELDVTADVNPLNVLPDPVDAYSAPSAVVTNAPGGGNPGGGNPGGGNPGGGNPGGGNHPKPKPPVLGKVLLSRGSAVFTLTGGGSVKLVLQIAVPGHRVRGGCASGKRKHARGCAFYKTLITLHRASAKGGKLSISLPTRIGGKALAAGTYRLIVIPLSTSGVAGKSRTLGLVLIRHH